jgi:hypothetical protein
MNPNEYLAHLERANRSLLAALEEVVCDLQFSEAPQHKHLVLIAREAITAATATDGSVFDAARNVITTGPKGEEA